jgi:hypothetical protein
VRRTSVSRCLDSGFSHTDFSTLKMEAIRSSETSVLTRYTRRHIPEDGIILLRRLHMHVGLYFSDKISDCQFLGNVYPP